jgi:hypothetical protein
MQIADREPKPVQSEFDDDTIRGEQDVENEECDPEEQVPDSDVVDDITGVDQWEVGEDGNGDVIKQAIEEAPVGPTTTINDTVGTTVEGLPATGRP